MVELKRPKGRVKCWNCGEILTEDEINSNIGLEGEHENEFYCDYCVPFEDEEEEEEWEK